MNGSHSLPLSRNASELLASLRSEVSRLQRERARFHELSPECRLGSIEAYDDRIRARQELLALLDDVPLRARQ